MARERGGLKKWGRGKNKRRNGFGRLCKGYTISRKSDWQLHVDRVCGVRLESEWVRWPPSLSSLPPPPLPLSSFLIPPFPSRMRFDSYWKPSQKGDCSFICSLIVDYWCSSLVFVHPRKREPSPVKKTRKIDGKGNLLPSHLLSLTLLFFFLPLSSPPLLTVFQCHPHVVHTPLFYLSSSHSVFFSPSSTPADHLQCMSLPALLVIR